MLRLDHLPPCRPGAEQATAAGPGTVFDGIRSIAERFCGSAGIMVEAEACTPRRSAPGRTRSIEAVLC